REAIRSGQPVRWEEESVYPAGRRYGEVAVTPLYDAGGVARHLIGIVHDITERKRLEKSLRESAERLRLAMSSGTIGNWDWDVINGRLTWSPELCEINGVEAGAARTYEDLVHGCIRTISPRWNPSAMPPSATTNSSTLISESFVHPARFDGSLAGGRDITTGTAASCVWSGTISTLPSASGPKRRCRNGNSGCVSRSTPQEQAPGCGIPARVTSIGMIVSASYTVSLRKSRARSKPG